MIEALNIMSRYIFTKHETDGCVLKCYRAANLLEHART